MIKGEKPILYNKSVLECANGGFLIASESKPEAQAVSDDMKWQARAELGLQILSNALIGTYTGYEFIDRNAADLDLDVSSIPLTIASYYHTDIAHATSNDSPETSALIGAPYTAANFILGTINRVPGMPSWTRHLGTELSVKDVLWAITITGIGYGSDKGEEALSNSTTNIIKTIEKSQIDFSSKSVIAATSS